MEQEFSEFSEFVQESNKSLKSLSCWHFGGILLSIARGGGFEPLYYNDKYFCH